MCVIGLVRGWVAVQCVVVMRGHLGPTVGKGASRRVWGVVLRDVRTYTIAYDV